MDLIKLAPYFLLLASFSFIGMALYIFFHKKPIILNSIWTVIMMYLGFIPVMLSSVEMLFSHPSLTGFFTVLMFIFLIIWAIYNMKGYMVYGADGSDFQKYFIECLNDKHYEFEQSLSSIKIKNPELELFIGVQS